MQYVECICKCFCLLHAQQSEYKKIVDTKRQGMVDKNEELKQYIKDNKNHPKLEKEIKTLKQKQKRLEKFLNRTDVDQCCLCCCCEYCFNCVNVFWFTCHTWKPPQKVLLDYDEQLNDINECLETARNKESPSLSVEITNIKNDALRNFAAETLVVHHPAETFISKLAERLNVQLKPFEKVQYEKIFVKEAGMNIEGNREINSTPINKFTTKHGLVSGGGESEEALFMVWEKLQECVEKFNSNKIAKNWCPYCDEYLKNPENNCCVECGTQLRETKCGPKETSWKTPTSKPTEIELAQLTNITENKNIYSEAKEINGWIEPETVNDQFFCAHCGNAVPEVEKCGDCVGKKVFCTACHKPTKTNFNFCGECREPLNTTCRNCNTAVRAYDYVCYSCGETLRLKKKRCPSCNVVAKEKQKFCKNCGSHLENKI